MIEGLLMVTDSFGIQNYTLKDLALYFEKYDGYVCQIETEVSVLKFKIEKASLPHLIGMHYAFTNNKNKNEYKGLSGFEKLKNGRITYNDIKRAVSKNTRSSISWKNIKERIEYLPMFLNTIEQKKNSVLKKFDTSETMSKTKMKADYILAKNLVNNIYPCLTLKKVSPSKVVIETFIVEKNIRLFGAFDTEKIISINLFPPLAGVTPITLEKEEIQ